MPTWRMEPAVRSRVEKGASAQSICEAGRALIAKEDFTGAQRACELAASKGYRAAGVDLAR